MKRIILGLIVVTLFGCSKTAPMVISVTPTTPPTPVVITPIEIPKIVYYGKTSYELKTTATYVNMDSVRAKFGRKINKEYNINSAIGWVYVDMNNDGVQDIFYPCSSGSDNIIDAEVFINVNGNYIRDKYMLPDGFGNSSTRKTLVGDFNNDSLPDLFLINHGYENPSINYYPGEVNRLLLSDKKTGKYTNGTLPDIGKAFWHGGASGDLNGDGNIDIIVIGGNTAKLLYSDGKGNFIATDWKYKAGDGYITAEIVDIDKDGQNDIILSGAEGTPPPGRYSPSTIFWNNHNDFSKQTIICSPSTDGWGGVMDIAVEDIDGDGINEIFLDRTGDITGVKYGGYNMTIYKKNGDTYEDVSDKFIEKHKYVWDRTGYWMMKMFLNKEKDGTFTINGYITLNSTVQTWKQNPTTKTFYKYE